MGATSATERPQSRDVPPASSGSHGEGRSSPETHNPELRSEDSGRSLSVGSHSSSPGGSQRRRAGNPGHTVGCVSWGPRWALDAPTPNSPWVAGQRAEATGHGRTRLQPPEAHAHSPVRITLTKASSLPWSQSLHHPGGRPHSGLALNCPELDLPRCASSRRTDSRRADDSTWR